MRNKIVLVFLFSLLIPIHFSSAYISLPSSTDFGGSANPINIQIQPDYNAQRRQENLSKESQLKIQYGYSIYSSCKSSVCGSYNAVDPFSESSCLSMLEAWLGGGKCMAQRKKENENTKCATGYVKTLQDGWYGCSPIKSDNQICIDKYGSNVSFTEFDKEGTRICDCKVGYQWNQEQTGCILIPSNKVINSGGGGGGSKSTITCNGKEWNDCPLGQKFSCPSVGDAQCLISPKAETVKVIAPVVKKEETELEKKIYNDICNSRGPNSYYYGFLDGPGDPACACIGGYTRANLPKDPCIIKTSSIDKEQIVDKKLVVSSNKDSGNIETIQKEEEIKSKSFWTKIKNWLGF